jgi:hypothetical protein
MQDPTLPARRQVEPAPAPAAPAVPAAALPRSELAGLVLDARSLPVAGALVTAESLERERGMKNSRFGERARTGTDGRFVLQLEVDGPWQSYTVRVHQDGHAVWNSTPIRVPAGRAAEPLRVTLARDATIDGEPCRLRVTVVDGAGAAIPGALVQLLPAEAGRSWRTMHSPEVTLRSDANGTAELTSSRLGPRLLVVDASERGLAPRHDRIELTAPGERALRVQLEPGRSIRGRIAGWTPDSGHHFQLSAVRDGHGERQWAEFAPDGSFAIHGLAAGGWTLLGQSGRWSDFTLSDVAAGTSDLLVELKPVQEQKDRGMHDAEIHGTLHDTVIGRDLPCGVFDVELRRLADDDTQLDVDLLQELAHGFIGQVAAGPDLPEPDGFFHLTGLQPGRYVVHATQRGRAFAWTGPITLGPREIRTGVRLELRAGARVSGVVVDPRGQPLAGARVLLVGRGEQARMTVAGLDREVHESHGRDDLPYDNQQKTDASGRFTLDHLPPDLTFSLAVVHHAHEPALGPLLLLRDRESRDGLRLQAGAPRR